MGCESSAITSLQRTQFHARLLIVHSREMIRVSCFNAIVFFLLKNFHSEAFLAFSVSIACFM